MLLLHPIPESKLPARKRNDSNPSRELILHHVARIIVHFVKGTHIPSLKPTSDIQP